MADIRGVQSKDDSDYQRPVFAELCRMTWLAFGPLGVVFSGVSIWSLPPWTYSRLDWIFWGIATLVVLARFVEIRFFRGTTTENKPATMSDWWRYTAKFTLFAVALWVLAQWR